MMDYLKPLALWLKKNVILNKFTGYHTGGRAQWLFEPDTTEVLIRGVKIFSEHGIPFYVLGGGTNILVADKGVEGVVIRLSKPAFRFIEMQKDGIKCGPGVTTREFSASVLSQSLSGFEFLAGFPGTIGGAVYGNAGGTEGGICTMLEKVTALSPKGELICFLKEMFDYGYRSFPLIDGMILVELLFRREKGETPVILKKMDEIRRHRRTSDPKGFSCGSVFKNPKEMKAWEVIDKLGLRGRTIGGAVISAQHSNWIINQGTAVSQDIFDLIRLVQKEALAKLKIEMHPEVKMWGNFDKK